MRQGAGGGVGKRRHFKASALPLRDIRILGLYVLAHIEIQDFFSLVHCVGIQSRVWPGMV